MQERYCHCGARVFVQYVVGKVNRHLFWSLTLRGGGKVQVCPCCGGELNINALR